MRNRHGTRQRSSSTLNATRAALGLAALSIATATFAGPASAQLPAPPPAGQPEQLSQKFSIDDQNPEASIPSDKEKNANPLEFGYLLQDLIARAEQARKMKDNAAVVRYYRAIAKGVPDQAKGWSKLCEAYQVVNDRDRAVRACRYAIDRPGVELQDYMRFVSLTVAKPGELTPAETKDLKDVIEHLGKERDVGLAYSHAACQAGVKIKDVAILEACTAALEKAAPDDSKTVIFKWSLAVQKGQRQEAARLLDKAREIGIVPESLERMETVTFGAPRRHAPAWALVVLGGALLLTALALALWTVRRRRAFAHH
jgi:tetratricopeptide (TPR) repeat protein